MPAVVFPDQPSYDKMARAVHSHGDGPVATTVREFNQDTFQQTLFIGKPDTDFTQGLLAAPDNVISIWEGGPANPTDADTGSNLEVHYATTDLLSTEYVVAQLVWPGFWYVSALLCPGEGGGSESS